MAVPKEPIRLAKKTQLPYHVGGQKKIIIKCSECGNRFSKEGPIHEEMLSCPTCEAQYKAVVDCGKLRIETFVYCGKDAGEL